MSPRLETGCWRKPRTIRLAFATRLVMFAFIFGMLVCLRIREKKSLAVMGILQTLHNSVNKHLADKDFERLKWRINWALEKLSDLGDELMGDGLDVVARFIKNAANYLVTFARLALKETVIPLTNNLIERLMGEIAKRIKHKWMHWSTKGLENLLNILLARYCNRRFYAEMKERYLSPNSTQIQIAIT